MSFNYEKPSRLYRTKHLLVNFPSNKIAKLYPLDLSTLVQVYVAFVKLGVFIFQS